jgi:archaemetzincin
VSGAGDGQRDMAAPEAPAATESTWREIAIAPLAGVANETIDHLLAELSRRVHVSCRRVACPTAPPLDRVPGRSQIDADRWLERLEAHAQPGIPLVGVTETDLALPIFTFVFGRARLAGGAAVISLARLRPEFYGLSPDLRLVARRAAAELLHELGHVAGLAHCERPDCLMRFAASVEAADLRGSVFCADCAARLPPGLISRAYRLPAGPDTF